MPATAPPATQDELSGRSLYGDTFSPAQIEQWYESEVSGYFDLITTHYKIANEQNQYDYEYEALNRYHAVGDLLKRRFDTCVALGCAAGQDIEPLAPVVNRFVAIEPAEKWWRDEIGGKPAQFIKPSVIGDIPMETASADLAASFGVLHHIPNVSHVMGEIARILKPGGLFVVREPITSMGDWRKARPGCTANERGLPLEWFENTARKVGFRIASRRTCMFNPLIAVGKKLGFPTPLSVMPIVRLDAVISRAMQWNARYWRDTFTSKLAPSSAFWVLERVGG